MLYKVVLFLSTPSISNTELDGDVLGPGSYGYLRLPMFRGGSDAGRHTALARALHPTGYFGRIFHHGGMC